MKGTNQNDYTESSNENENNPKQKRVLKLKNLTPKQKAQLQSASAGLAGVSLGAVSMMLMGTSFSSSENSDKPDGDPTPSNITPRRGGDEELDIPIYSDAPFSDAVTDDMSFSEAFGAARRDIGPGGFFEWKGETFNTYYKEEWDDLSKEEQNEFYASVDDNHSKDDMVSEEEILDILNEDTVIVEVEDLDYEDIIIIEDDNSIDIADEDGIIIEDDYDDDPGSVGDDEVVIIVEEEEDTDEFEDGIVLNDPIDDMDYEVD